MIVIFVAFSLLALDFYFLSVISFCFPYQIKLCCHRIFYQVQESSFMRR